MTCEQKMAFIIAKLNEDVMETNTGKILKAVLIMTVPSLQDMQLIQIVTLLGGNPNENPEENP